MKDFRTPRGVTALAKESWVVDTSGSLSRVSRHPLDIVASFDLASDDARPLESTAISADSWGRLWVVSARGGPTGQGVLTQFDPELGDVTAQIPLGRLPRGQGDLTGWQDLGEFAPQGSASHVFEGCGPLARSPDVERSGQASEWLRVHVASTTGADTHVRVQARHAIDRDALADADFLVLGELPDDPSPFALAFEPGGVVEVRLTLYVGGRIGAPRIARVGLEWRCPGPV